ncbi:MAG: cation transporter [Chlamydiales bacterium 38-26]|nr:CusA/CzcA family heavy metal efflux RND transporter [Chlamydiales bacterium]OJV11204.1 MAG: cation transporter [Chlamydiales bacterium 38-26]
MIEKILGFSVNHRYLVAILTFCVMLYGIYALRHLPVDAVPDITNNQVQINTLAGGLSPVEVEKNITFPIETALSGIPGLESTRSLSRSGFSQVTAVFHDHVNIYFARQQINERLLEVRESLPPGADPKMGPISTGLSEVFMWVVDYDSESRQKHHYGSLGWQKDGSYLTPEGQSLKNELELSSYLRTIQDWVIRPQLKSIKGLAGIDAIGGFVRQYHIEPNIEKMIALGINFNDLLQAIKDNNLNIGAGYIERGGESFLVKADARIESQDHIGSIIITTREGVPISIKDVADIGIGKELRSGSASEDGKEVVIGTAMMLIGENSRTVAEAVKEKLTAINETLPPGIVAKPVLNRTKLIDTTIHTVTLNLVEGAILVMTVLFVFLGNFRAALITAMVIPLSMLMTAVGMVQTKISGNLMSLGAIDFGLIVDGAVIIVENCLRRLGDKQRQLGRTLELNERLSEVMQASQEMIQPSVYGQAIIMTVYLPILTLSGVEGKMFHPMALTVLFALLSAFILSLTFVPAMVAILVNGKVKEHENKLIHQAKNLYEPILRFALNHPYGVISSALVLVISSLILFSHLGQEFVPTLDEQDLAIQASRIPSTSLSQATSMQLGVEKAIRKFQEVAFVYSKTGTAEMASDPMPPYASDTFVILKPRHEWPDRKRTKLDLISAMEEQLKQLPGNIYEFTQPIEMRFNELIAGVRSDVAVKIYGDDYHLMKKTADDIAMVIQKVPGAADVAVDKTDGLPTLQIDVDRQALSRHQLNIKDVLDVIEVAIGGGKAGMIFEGDRRYDLVVRLPEKVRSHIPSLERIPLSLASSGSGEKSKYAHIPLNEVANLTVTTGLNQISRENGKRMVVVQANVRGADLSTFVEQAKKKLHEEIEIPAGYWIEWGGEFENLLSARERLMVVVPICFFMIFILLYTAFKSVRRALLVFTGVPLALTGGIFALWIRDIPFSISAGVGFIALSGIAVLNSLVLVSYITQLIEKGIAWNEAIHQGALLRFRPVLVTALVASLGFLPMALAEGAGAEVQRPLATVVIGGLMSSTLLTLVVLPALYQLFTPRKKELYS